MRFSLYALRLSLRIAPMTDKTVEANNLMDKIVALARHRGFIFPGSEIYGGLANSWDYGPLGVELKNNIKRLWWKIFVQQRADMVGVDGAIIMNSKVWEASGHIKTFHDPLIECRSCHTRFRADQIDTKEPCTVCGKADQFTNPANFNLMLKTHIGPTAEKGNEAYLRPETAQTMFVDFPQVVQSMRRKLPFGIAQIGKAFRNEITPGNFIYRTREFEIMELEYFVAPEEWETHFEMWKTAMHEWIERVGIDASRVHELEVSEEDRAHYSSRTVDFEFDYPFGRKELYGLAYRSDYDLRQHARASGQDLQYTDTTGKHFFPHVIEPTFGVDRTVLAVLLSAYHEEAVRGEKRVVLKLSPALAPYYVAVLPLSKKAELTVVSEKIASTLRQYCNVDHDVTQSIGKRYRRQDEIGTPYCVTVDFESLKDTAVTVRDRDSMAQERVAVEKVEDYLKSKIQSSNDKSNPKSQ